MLRHCLTVALLFYFTAVFSQEQVSLYFDSNKFELTKKEENRLNQWLLANSNNKIVAIHGFTDEDGTSGFNDTLAQKRVDFIFFKFLLENNLKNSGKETKINYDLFLNFFLSQCFCFAFGNIIFFSFKRDC